MDNPKADENTTSNEITPPLVPDVPDESKIETPQEMPPVNSGRNISATDNSVHNTNITNNYYSGDLHSLPAGENTDPKDIRLTPISSNYREKIDKVFERPDKFSDFLSKVTSNSNDQRVIIITGEGSCVSSPLQFTWACISKKIKIIDYKFIIYAFRNVYHFIPLLMTLNTLKIQSA